MTVREILAKYSVEQLRRMRVLIEKAVQSLDDEDALEAGVFYPHWDGNGVEYPVDYRVLYGEDLYRVITAHTSQQGWNPAESPSLFAKVLTDEEGGTVLPWEQPDSTNPYMEGDHVMHNDKEWVSLINNNVWEPGVYGWAEVNN